jgi:hypothetical protein
VPSPIKKFLLKATNIEYKKWKPAQRIKIQYRRHFS